MSTAASLGLLALGPADGAASPGALKLLDGFLKVYSAAPALRSKHKDYLKVKKKIFINFSNNNTVNLKNM